MIVFPFLLFTISISKIETELMHMVVTLNKNSIHSKMNDTERITSFIMLSPLLKTVLIQISSLHQDSHCFPSTLSIHIYNEIALLNWLLIIS